MQNEPSVPGFNIDDLLVHREWVGRVARTLVYGDAEAEDLEQRAWVRILERPPSVAPRAPRGWLRGVLRFAAIDQVREGKTRRRHEEGAAAPERVDATPDDLVARAETLDRLVHAVLELKEPYRGTILLRYFEDLKPAEIAHRQRLPVETVRTRTKRAIAMLRERLDSESRGDRQAWCLALLPLMGKQEAVGSTAAASATAASAATGLTLGGILMANKALAAVAAVVLLAGAGWLAFRPSEMPAPVLPPVVAKSDSPSHRTILKPPPSTVAPDSEKEDVLPPPVDLAKCDRDLDLHGTVMDTEGNAVAGARIQALAFPGRRTFVLNREEYFRAVNGPKTRSSSDGTFSMRLRRGDLVDLRVDAPGTAETIVPQCQAGERVRVVLEPGAKLEVAVKDEQGRAVEIVLRLEPSKGR